MTGAHRDRSIGWKGGIGIASCVAGLAVIYFGYGISTKATKKDAAAEVSPSIQQKDKRPVRAMNLALGNMVYFARDLGFSVQTAGGASVDASKIAARIENQLHGIREIYRQEIARNETLAGVLVLQLRLSPTGEVDQVREHGSRLPESEFKKIVIAETAKWSFAEIVTQTLDVICPLLFVQEGMDITTLVRWEKSLETVAGKTTAPRPSDKAVNVAPAPARPAARSASSAPPRSSEKSDGKEFRIRYATSLRQQPNFSAPTLLTLNIGTKVTVLRRHGDWLEIRPRAEGPIGFIRKEFVTPPELPGHSGRASHAPRPS